MTIKKGIVIIVIFILGLPGVSFSVPAAPDIIEIDQPDGNVFPGKKRGDEWNNWVETTEGYTVKKGADGFWYYLQQYNRDLPVFSNRHAHRPPHAGMKKHIRPEKKYLRVPPGQGKKGKKVSVSNDSEESWFSSQGTPEVYSAGAPMSSNVLFILAEFNNVSGTYSEEDFATFINNNISDYFNKASFGTVTLLPANESSGTANNGVIDWINVGMDHPNNTNEAQVANNAIVAADTFVDYSAFDSDGDGYVDSDELAIVVITAGYECAYGSPPGDCMWGHRSSISPAPVVDGVTVGSYHGSRGGYAEFGEIHINHQATMGIMVHELGHLVFNLPDLYDTDGGSEGIGAYGVMGGGSWGKASSATYSGETPVLPCAWSRYVLGWIEGTETSGSGTLTAPGSSSANSSNTAYRLMTGSANEYFWVENRHPVGYDTGLQRWLGSGYGGGLNIWHIDKNKLNNQEECAPPADCSSSHFMLAVEQADANWDLENDVNRGNVTDLWFSGNVDAFDDLSLTDSDLYDGTASGVSVMGISVQGETMSATFAAPRVTVFEDNFESGSFAAEWNTSSTGAGQVLITRDNYPRTGIYHVTMDTTTAGSNSLNELILTLDLSGKSGVLLSFFQMEVGDEDHPMPVSFTGSGNYDGVAISEDGSFWHRVVDLGIARNNFEYTVFNVDLDSAITSAGISYNSSFMIKFQQYDNYPFGYDGFAFDEVQVTVAVPLCNDIDEDGYGSPGDASCPNGPQTDCDDSDGNEYPGQTWYEDVDGDLYSSGNVAVQCLRPVNHYVSTELTATTGDCDDSDPVRFPGNPEVCDGMDNNCDLSVDNGLTPPLNDLQNGVCSGSAKTCSGVGGWVNDYTGVTGYEASETTCDSLDNDCDGPVDEGLTTTYYRDFDSDTYGEFYTTTDECSLPAGYVLDNTDCDDSDGNEYPGQIWYEDVDGDLYSSGNFAVQCLRPAGYYIDTELTATSGDCDDSDLNLYPGAVKVIGGSAGYYSPLMNAYVAASGDDTLQNMEETITGDIDFNLNKTVTLEGGYNCGYASVSGLTTISGDMTVSNGTVFIGDIILQ